MNLFKKGDFTLHSGKESWFKIDCDSLTREDLETLALLAIETLQQSFSHVEGVPRGGLKFAEAIRPYMLSTKRPDWVWGNPRLLIVDDVSTTWGSMEEQRAGRDATGLVIFDRGPNLRPAWCHALFTLEGNTKMNDLKTETVELERELTETVEPESPPDPVELETEPEFSYAPNDTEKYPWEIKPCGAWCFVLGVAVGAFCSLEVGHEGDHQTVIKVLVEPVSRFTITWSLGE